MRYLTPKGRQKVAKRQLVLDAYSRVARPVIRQVTSAESCIFSTRVTLEVLSRFGIGGRPLSVQAILKNRQRRHADQLRKQHGWSDQQFNRFRDRAGAYSVGVGVNVPKATPHSFSAHLVAITNAGDLVDASLDQGSRPDRGIDVPGVVVVSGVPHGYQAGTDQWIGQVSPDGWSVEYLPVGDAGAFRVVPDWNLKEIYLPIATAIERLVREEVA
jgi:CBS domain-containing protein